MTGATGHPIDPASGRRDGLPLLEMRGVRKSFGSTVALAGVDLSVRHAEVHALIGENGAGKSTLMKVLSGAHAPDEGVISFAGRRFSPRRPVDARRAGIGMIYQELELAPDLSVEANVLLGMEDHTFGIVDRARHRGRVSEALRMLGHPEISPDALVRDLSIGAQQVVEIARAIVARARLIVLDEPTSSLTLKDTERLFEVIERLKQRGVSVIYISHFLEEVFRIGDRYTVLRNGETVDAGDLGDVSASDIVRAMIGRPLTELFPRERRARGEPLLQMHGVHGDPLPRDVTLVVYSGEILGVAGLIGAGRTELLRAVYGLDPVREGTITVGDVSSGWRPPAARLNQGIGFASENRKEEGLALDRTIAENVTLGDLGSVSRWGWISPRRERERVAHWIEQVGVKCRGPSQRAGDLSGGNQQKVALARLLHQDADILLLDEPTRGVDVGSKAQIYRLMGDLAAHGKGILFVSSYMPELLGVCDRIAVFSRGRIVDVRAASDWTEHGLLLAATSVEDSPVTAKSVVGGGEGSAA